MDNESYEFLSKILYPTEFNDNYILAYYTFNSDLKNIIEKSEYKIDFTKKYFKSLKFLVNLKRNCTGQSLLFEKLMKVQIDLYSIKLHGVKNIRILFIFKVINDKEYAILLNAFQEKDRSDYTNGILVAYDRAKRIG